MRGFVYKCIPEYCKRVDDLQRVVKFDKKGNEIIEWIPIDYKKLAEELGTVDMWSLDALLKAGINPGFSISTTPNARVESINVLNDLVSEIDGQLSSRVEEKIDEEDSE